MTVDKINQVLELPFPPERVWRAITQPQELSQWFGDRVYLDPVAVGSEIVLEWDAYGRTSGIVEVVDPPRRFAYRWRAHGVDEREPMTPSNSTLVSFELLPTDQGTRLEVVETGFAGLPAAIRAAAFRENERGWKTELKELVEYITR